MPHKDEPKITGPKHFKGTQSGYQFSWHFWIYISDWNYKFGQVKHIFSKGEKPGVGYGQNKKQCPGIFLAKKKK